MIGFVKGWRGLTVLALIVWILSALVCGGFWIDGLLDGNIWDDSNLIQSFVEGGPYISYKEIYEMLLHMFLLNLLNIFVCVVSLSYQSKVIAEQSLLPGGKWIRPVVVVVMHGVSFFAAHLMFPGGLF